MSHIVQQWRQLAWEKTMPATKLLWIFNLLKINFNLAYLSLMTMLDVSHQHIPWRWWCLARQEHHSQIAELKDPLYHSWFSVKKCSKKVQKHFSLLELKSELLYIHCVFVKFLSSRRWLTSGDMKIGQSGNYATHLYNLVIKRPIEMITIKCTYCLIRLRPSAFLWQAAYQHQETNQLLP